MSESLFSKICYLFGAWLTHLIIVWLLFSMVWLSTLSSEKFSFLRSIWDSERYKLLALLAMTRISLDMCYRVILSSLEFCIWLQLSMDNPLSTIVANLSMLFSIRPRYRSRKSYSLSIEPCYACEWEDNVVSLLHNIR
jgi:hypothetical protein